MAVPAEPMPEAAPARPAQLPPSHEPPTVEIRAGPVYNPRGKIRLTIERERNWRRCTSYSEVGFRTGGTETHRISRGQWALFHRTRGSGQIRKATCIACIGRDQLAYLAHKFHAPNAGVVTSTLADADYADLRTHVMGRWQALKTLGLIAPAAAPAAAPQDDDVQFVNETTWAERDAALREAAVDLDA
jgi:hypothetical protein